MRVIFDIDDVLVPWAEKVHMECVVRGLNPEGKPWTQWEMWSDYGCTKEQWIEVVNSLVVPDGIYHAPPYPGVNEALADLEAEGHELWLVTARGFFDHAEEIRLWTQDWIKTYQIPGTLLFAQDKGEVAANIGATHAIDDRYENAWSMLNAGAEVYLMNQPHNQACDWANDYRVDSVREFVFRILND